MRVFLQRSRARGAASLPVLHPPPALLRASSTRGQAVGKVGDSCTQQSRPQPNAKPDDGASLSAEWPSGSTAQKGRGGSSAQPLSPKYPRIDLIHRPATIAPSYWSQQDWREAKDPLADPSHGALHKAMVENWKATRPKEKTLQNREQLLRKVETALKSVSSSDRWSIAVFGSVMTSLDVDSSDLDVSFFDESRPQGYETPPPTTGVYDLSSRLQKAVRQQGIKTTAIPHASVPILKCFDTKTGLHLDINVNCRDGTNNSAWFLSYATLAPYTFLPFLHAVKTWAKARGINDPSGANGQTSLSSYTLCLLCLSFLQAGYRLDNVPTPLLPNLQDPDLIAHYGVEPTTLFLRCKLPRQYHQRSPLKGPFDTTFVPVAEDGSLRGLGQEEVRLWRELNASIDLGDLLKQFFSFYAGLSGDFSFQEVVVSPKAGGFIRERSALSRSTAAMDVQDPFIKKQLAAPINDPMAKIIAGEFKRGFNILSSPTSTLESLYKPRIKSSAS